MRQDWANAEMQVPRASRWMRKRQYPVKMSRVGRPERERGEKVGNRASICQKTSKPSLVVEEWCGHRAKRGGRGTWGGWGSWRKPSVVGSKMGRNPGSDKKKSGSGFAPLQGPRGHYEVQVSLSCRGMVFHCQPQLQKYQVRLSGPNWSAFRHSNPSKEETWIYRSRAAVSHRRHRRGRALVLSLRSFPVGTSGHSSPHWKWGRGSRSLSHLFLELGSCLGWWHREATHKSPFFLACSISAMLRPRQSMIN